jgi:DNA-binding HxlR family transcriptional regulator
VTDALRLALDRVGDRWTPLVVEALLGGPKRYGELAAAVEGIAPNILADRLRRLERDRLVVVVAYSERPPRAEYRLTAEGRELAAALRLLADWGASLAGATAGSGDGAADDAGDGVGDDAGPGPAHEPIRHVACGTPLEARWYCPTCAVVVDDRHADPGEERRV